MININRKIFTGLAAGIFIFGCLVPVSAKRAKNEVVDNSALVELNEEETSSSKKAKGKKGSKNQVESQQSDISADQPVKKAKPERMKVVDSVPDEGVFQAKTVENTVGRMKYLMKGTVGSFQMYALGSNGSQTPLLAGYDEFTSSFMSLLVGKKEYKLTNNIGIVIGARKNELGAQLVYIVPEVARVFVKFEKVDGGKDVKSEIIKVTSVVYNKGKTTQNYALKSVLDTVLGEQFGPHYSSADELAINNERQYRRFDKMKWLTSRNSRVGMQFLFYGADITPPEVVSISNKDFLALRDWVPSITVSRTFDSVLSYQNSAVCINWPSAVIEPGESVSYSYYMAVSTDGEACDGEKFVENLTKKLKGGNLEEKYSVKEFEDGIIAASELYAKGRYTEAHEIVMKMWENPDNRNERLASLICMIEQKLGIETDKEILDYKNGKLVSEKKVSVAKPEFTVDSKNISKAQLDYGYVQALLDRISELEKSDEVDRNEIYKLNAELDAILEKLRKQ